MCRGLPVFGAKEVERDGQVVLQCRYGIASYVLKTDMYTRRLHGFVGRDDVLVVSDQQTRERLVERIAVE